MKAILAFLAKLFAAFGLGWLREKRGEAAQRDLGAATAAVETGKVISDAAQEQADLNAVHRGGADDVAERLRREFETKRRGRGDIGGSGFPQN